ncbi:sigma-70 family RNA polymerase sigma factor [Streptomyces sp. TR06-5]|uniref:sigma-70 family RNA polymerase sigma factor n=1 Tax=unclassified Streptomyces TaxID=2593676 RepID=UPI0039A3AD38
MDAEEITGPLNALLAAECAAEAHGTAADPEDLHQAVRLRWLERVRAEGRPAVPAAWLRAAVRAEARRERRRARREVPLGRGLPTDPTARQGRRVLAADGHGDPASETEEPLLAAERRRAVRAAVERMPGRCPMLLRAFLDGGDRTYREIAYGIGIPRGALGPLRSRCLACLRRSLAGGVAGGPPRGRLR